MSRTLVALTAALFAAASFPVAAEDPASPAALDPLRAGRGVLTAERQSIVGANLSLTAEEAQAFWPLYHEYRGEMMKYGDRSIELLESLSKNFETMDDLTADGLLKEWLALKKQEWTAKQRWYARFARVIPPSKVLRFYQIENKIDTAILSALTESLPLAMPSRSSSP